MFHRLSGSAQSAASRVLIYRLTPSLRRSFVTKKAKKKKAKKKQQKATAASTEIICTLKELGRTVDGGRRSLFENVSLSFFKGAKIGVLGSNGSGKSTLIKAIAGVDDSYSGSVYIPDGVRVGYLPQEPQLDPTKTVEGNLLESLGEKTSVLEELDRVGDWIAEGSGPAGESIEELIEEQASLFEIADRLAAWDMHRQIELTTQALRCPPLDSPVGTLSGGEKRRVALSQLLLSEPDIMLLDEPTNHLDAQSVAWLEQFLGSYKGTVIAVTHDRYFLDNIAGWMVEVDRGKVYTYQGNYSAWLRQKQNRLDGEHKKDAARSKQLARELEWINSNRSSKNKARVNAYEELLSESGGGGDSSAGGAIVIPAGPRLGNSVIKATNLKLSFDGRTLFENLSFELHRSTIVGVVGANGAGKSTLFRLLTGQLVSETGTLSIGDTVKLGYVDQSREGLDPNRTVYEEIADGVDIVHYGEGRTISTRAFAAQFNFKGSLQEKRVGQCSGGERNRVHIAKMVKGGHNVLLLDEPTNDLDVDTLRSLEEALPNFDGCAVVISHDRYFLDRICTDIIAFEGDGRVEVYPGNWSEYEAAFERRTETAKKSKEIALNWN